MRSTGVGDGDIGPSVEVDQHGHEGGTLSSHRRAGLRERRDWSVVKLLLADERLDPNIADKSGITALWGTWGVGRRAAPWSRLATSIES